jgi:hypothetical protein
MLLAAIASAMFYLWGGRRRAGKWLVLGIGEPSFGLKLLYPYTLPYANDPLCLFTG